MTPEKARELRAGDFDSSEWCSIVGNLEAGVDQLGGPYITGTPGDFALVEAGPALAELVAGLKREYALLVPVETGVPGEPVWKYFVRKHEDGAAIVTQYPTIARWFEEGADLDLFARMNSIPTYRVVHRLASKPEVVQP